MNEDLQDEVEAIRSIYGDDTLTTADQDGVYILHLPQQTVSLRLQFAAEYPAVPPSVTTQSSGDNARKGEAAHVVGVFRDMLGRLFQPGQVCLFDVIEEVNNVLESQRGLECLDDDGVAATARPDGQSTEPTPILGDNSGFIVGGDVPWTLSDVVVEMKSVFVARCAPVSSPEQAKLYLSVLLDNDKKVRSATHNITAWRIKGDSGVTFQDCDDDGETAAGGRVLHLMQLMDIWNVMVVVTRWYGGHQLGPKRFSIINTVARDAFVKGEFVTDSSTKKKGKR